jgi:hypothetical protein
VTYTWKWYTNVTSYTPDTVVLRLRFHFENLVLKNQGYLMEIRLVWTDEWLKTAFVPYCCFFSKPIPQHALTLGENQFLCYQVREQRQNPVNAVFETGVWYIRSDLHNTPPHLIGVVRATNNTKDIHSQVKNAVPALFTHTRYSYKFFPKVYNTISTRSRRSKNTCSSHTFPFHFSSVWWPQSSVPNCNLSSLVNTDCYCCPQNLSPCGRT